MSLVAAHQWLHLDRPSAAEPGTPSLDDDMTLAALADVASAAGYPCTEFELLTAFQQDWTMRWLRYAQFHRPDDAR